LFEGLKTANDGDVVSSVIAVATVVVLVFPALSVDVAFTEYVPSARVTVTKYGLEVLVVLFAMPPVALYTTT